MDELIKMIVAALGAVAGAAAILIGLTVGVAVVTTAAGGVALAVVAGLPVVACIGGVAYAASQTGYSTSST